MPPPVIDLPTAPDGPSLRLLRALDWRAHALGPPDSWPRALRVALGMILNSPEAMYIAWGPTRALLFNDAYAPILGPRVATAMGRPFAEVWHDVWDRVCPMVDAVFAGGRERFVNLPLTMARDGVQEETFWTFSLSPLRDDTDAIAGLLCVVTEQTASMAADRRRDHTEQALRDEVADGLVALDRVEEQLRQSQKIEAIGQLTGGVAHDFNNLLTVIKGSVELLRRPGLAPDRQARYLEAIGDTADRAAGLTRQLLAFARRQALSPEVFDVGASLREVMTIVTSLTGSRIRIALDVPDAPLHAMADRGQLDTAIVNMAVNARDAMNGAGLLTLSVAAVNGLPAIRAHEPVTGAFVAITVSDTGSGIPVGRLPHIFEPFYTTKPVGAGTGLGLSQVFGFAKQSGGDLRVESTVGQGTSFTLYLPRTTQAAPAPLPAMLPDPQDGDGITVLVVEDNLSVGEFAADALRTLGYGSQLVADGESALGLLATDATRFQVVFSDVVMPGMGGLELARVVHERHPGLPVILTSGYSHVLATQGRRGIYLLHKPYSLDALSSAIRNAVAAPVADPRTAPRSAIIG